MNVLMNEAVKLSHDQFVMDLVTRGVHIGIMDKHFMPFGRELGVGHLDPKRKTSCRCFHYLSFANGGRVIANGGAMESVFTFGVIVS